MHKQLETIRLGEENTNEKEKYYNNGLTLKQQFYPAYRFEQLPGKKVCPKAWIWHMTFFPALDNFISSPCVVCLFLYSTKLTSVFYKMHDGSENGKSALGWTVFVSQEEPNPFPKQVLYFMFYGRCILLSFFLFFMFIEQGIWIVFQSHHSLFYKIQNKLNYN